MNILGFEIRRAGARAPEPEARSLENPNVSLSDPAALSMLGLGEGSGSNIVVTPQSALGLSAVYACVFYIAKTAGWIPCHLIQKAGVSTTIRNDEALGKLLNERPNSYQTPYIFRLSMFAQMLLWGNAYAEIQRDLRTGEPLGLYPIPAWECDPRLEKGVKTYRVNGQVLADDEVFHLQAPGFDGVRGLSPIRLHRLTVGMGLEALSYGEQFYKNGTRLAGSLDHPAKLSDDAAARLRSSWTATYAGKANAGKVAILEEGMKFNPFTMPMEDAQYVETRKFSVSDIARIYGVPPHKIGDLDRATFTNIEHQSIEAVNDCMMPHFVQFEQETGVKLLTDRQRQAGYEAKHNIKALLRGDIKSQMEALKMGREIGAYSVDDVLELLDRNPVGGVGGDERIRPMNFVPIGTPATFSKPREQQDRTNADA
jgi:HK97 family phage portal protein